MSHRDEDTGIAWISEEPDGKCELCGAIEETRPYGPGGKQVCFDCGMKDEAEAERQMGHRLFGEPLNVAQALSDNQRATDLPPHSGMVGRPLVAGERLRESAFSETLQAMAGFALAFLWSWKVSHGR